MKRRVVTVGAGDRLSTVEDIMRLGGVRHMPVVSSGRLVGVVSERDLLRASRSSIGESHDDDHRAFLHAVEIASVMSSPAVVISPKASVIDAARALAGHKIGCLPVVNDRGTLEGLITETDVLRCLAEAAGRVGGS